MPTLIAIVLNQFATHPISIDFLICLHKGEIPLALETQQKPQTGT